MRQALDWRVGPGATSCRNDAFPDVRCTVLDGRFSGGPKLFLHTSTVALFLAGLVLVGSVGGAFAGAPRLIEMRDASGHMGGLEGTFVAATRSKTLVHNPRRSRRRFVPASTFKIPNMLIALETGVAHGPGHMRPWDGARPNGAFWPDSWSRDHTLQSAMSNGVLWYFQAVAREVGRERMNAFVTHFEYGSQDIDGPIDRFWLDGPLAISALEQVEFLQRFYDGQLGLSEYTNEQGRTILKLEQTDTYTLFGKTGTAPLATGRMLSWFVGFVELPESAAADSLPSAPMRIRATHQGVQHVGSALEDDVIFFALNLDCPDLRACNHEMRRTMTKTILEAWSILGNPQK